MKKEKMNDKGFSLVELIIVIAIMAVLVVVLAPQYLKYVERSRNSTDLQNATTAVTACQVYAADPDATTPYLASKDFTITVDSTGATVAGDNKAAAIAALNDASITVDTTTGKTTDLKCKSKTKWTTFTITGKVDANGGISFEYTSTPANAFKDAMAGNTTTPSGSGS